MPVDFMRILKFSGRYGPLPVVLALTILIGCTSDTLGPVGTSLPIDMELNPVLTDLIVEIQEYGGLVVTDDENSFEASEVLYLGGGPDQASSIVARYDFSTLIDTFATFTDGSGDSIEISVGWIESVTLRLFLLNAYEDPATTSEKVEKHYRVYELSDTLVASEYPRSDEPIFDPSPLAFSDEVTNAVWIELPKSNLVDWTLNGQTGIIIRDEDSVSDKLIGYASKELDHFLEIELEDENTLVGPTITVSFAAELDHLPMTFQPIIDTSTLHGIPDSFADAADGLLLRTHSRRYPYFSFNVDFPDSARMINRAVLRVAIDTLTSFGPLTEIVLATIPTTLVSGRDSLTIQEIEASAVVITGNTSIDVKLPNTAVGDPPEISPWLGFDITAVIQRQANGLLADEPLSFLLSSGEDFFTGYSASWDPDFYMTVMNLFGTGHPDFQPYLEITYTEFSGGGK